jgi:tetratricopeptide (TPR) repeat protein
MNMFVRLRLHLVFALVVFWCVGGESRGDLNPEAKTPYRVQVVLSVAEHRMLTPAFKQQLESDLKAQLQLAFGKMANVDVVRAHRLLNDIRTKGLRPVLDAWAELSDIETVFLLVDFVDGRYVIEMGQHDGLTGLSSPVVRQQALASAQHVAATAAEMIHGDFSLVGTVDKVTANGVKVVFKGGALSDKLKTWVKRGDVFAVSRITQEGAKLRAARVEWAILQAVEDPEDGAVLCNYFHRYTQDQPITESPVVGFRCVKLNTTGGPVRLRVVDNKTQEFLSGLEIEVSADGNFTGKTQGATVDGFFKSSKSYDRVAYVRVLSGGTPLAQFPVEIVDDRVVVVRMSPNLKALKRGLVEQRRDRWVLWLYEALGVAAQSFQELNAVVTPKTFALAQEMATKSHAALGDEMERLRNEQAKLLELSAKDAPDLDLSEGEQLLKALALKHQELQRFLTKLEQTLKGTKETLDLQAKLQKAELLERQADFEKAITLYEDVLKVQSSAEVKAHLDLLKAAWAVKDPSHAHAREFVYAEWPRLDLAGVKANLGKAKEMFERCQKAGDFKTPLKLLHVNVQHATAVAKRTDVLKRAPDSLDNRLELKALIQVTGDLRALQKQVAAWVAKDKK